MRKFRGLVWLVASCGFAACAGAEIVNATGKVDWMLQAPGDARLRAPGSITGSMLIRAWDEAQNITLRSDLIVDAVSPGLYDSRSDLGTHVLPAGTEVSSHALLLKAPGDLAIAQARLSFASEILGVIVSDATSSRRRNGRLAASDDLGSGTLFDQRLLNRGLEMGSDWFQIAPDRLSVTFSLTASNPGDFARVITRSSLPSESEGFTFGGSSGMMLWDWEPENVPTPGSLALLGACLVGGLRRRR